MLWYCTQDQHQTIFAMSDAFNVRSSAANGTAKGKAQSSIAQYLLEWLACMEQSGGIKLKRRSRRRQDIQKPRRVGSLADHQQHAYIHLLHFGSMFELLVGNITASGTPVPCTVSPCVSWGTAGTAKEPCCTRRLPRQTLPKSGREGRTDGEEPGREYSWAGEREPQWGCTTENVWVL